ncbi:MAG: otsA [Cytophagaceae bacterium]|jgi:trehalose 6-phosphate synthase/phosphatase|nr:otsA [Cytophagaceae bacterium]
MKINKLIIVAYRMPFKLEEGVLVQNSGGLVSAILSLASQLKQTGQLPADQKITWVGCADGLPEDTSPEVLKNKEFELAPVYLETSLNEKFYGGFCNSTIWPLFHYYPFITQFEEENFHAYKEANELFCKAIEPLYEEGDLIWVHDYHLLLLPDLLRQKYNKATIGFFLHIPFPSFELFRLLPRQWQRELLNGILGADLAGFHINDYTQYFAKAVARVLGYDYALKDIMVEDRPVRTDTFPISIDYKKFNEAYDLPEVIEFREKVKTEQKEKKIIFSVDRLDYSKGLIHRLTGYQAFLEAYPEWKEKVVFIMVIVPSRDTILQYQDMKHELEETIGRINGKYGSFNWRPIIYMYTSLSFSELLGLYSVCDVALITPVRDGMNLVAKEFIASRKDKDGVLILSEMAGAAAELEGAIQINPTDKSQIAHSLYQALNMSAAEKNVRMENMQHRIKSYDIFRWSEDFISELDAIKNKQNRMKTRLVDQKIVRSIHEDYSQSTKRLFLFDYDGTLAAFNLIPSLAFPSESIFTLIRELAASSDNQIAIISGRDKDFMQQVFAELPVYLSAEHGAFLKKPSEAWISDRVQDSKWKEYVMPIFEKYVNRCPGTFIENKETGLCWHYRKAEASFSFTRSRELLEELSNVISNQFNLNVLDGNKVIEVKPSDCNKGIIAAKLIQYIQPDFILCIGDDVTDEDMFVSLPSYAHSIKVGNKSTHAQYNLPGQHQVLSFLVDITSIDLEDAVRN